MSRRMGDGGGGPRHAGRSGRGLLLAVFAAGMQAQAQSLPPRPEPGEAAVRAEGAAPPGAAIRPPSAEQGRELFARHCTRCHGVDARGTPGAPDLLPRVRGMSEDGFVSAVLQRYRWSLPASESGGESSGFEAMVHGILSRQGGTGTAAMPAWQSEPTVTQGVRDLHAYLSALAAAGEAGR